MTSSDVYLIFHLLDIQYTFTIPRSPSVSKW